MDKPKTYFEQVPLEIVKKIIDEQTKEEELTKPIQGTNRRQFGYYRWQEPYREALRESDHHKLADKIKAAENAIFLRFQELQGDSDHSRERMALNETVRALRALQTEKLHYPKLPSE